MQVVVVDNGISLDHNNCYWQMMEEVLCKEVVVDCCKRKLVLERMVDFLAEVVV